MTTSWTPEAGRMGAKAERGERDRYSREQELLTSFLGLN